MHVAEIVARAALSKLVTELASDIQMKLTALLCVGIVLQRFESVSQVAICFRHSLAIANFLCNVQIFLVVLQSFIIFSNVKTSVSKLIVDGAQDFILLRTGAQTCLKELDCTLVIVVLHEALALHRELKTGRLHFSEIQPVFLLTTGQRAMAAPPRESTQHSSKYRVLIEKQYEK